MTITYVGGITLGDALPGVRAPILAAMGDIQGRLVAMASFNAALVPPSIASDIETAGKILFNLQACAAAIASGQIAPPSIDLQAQIMLDVVALLKLQLQAFADLKGLFAFGAHVYAYQDQADALGGAFSTELAAGVPGGAGADTAYALLLVATEPAAWGAMAELFKTTP